MKNGVEVALLGQTIAVRTNQEEGFIQATTDLVRGKIEEAASRNQNSSHLAIALLACMNLAGEHLEAAKEHQLEKGEIRKRIESLIENL